MTVSKIVVGSGATRVIALHGWFGSSNGWGMLPELIDPDVFSWAFPDYRGYGSRRAESGDYTIAEIAADTVALADRLGWTGSRSLVTRWAARPRSGCSPTCRSG